MTCKDRVGSRRRAAAALWVGVMLAGAAQGAPVVGVSGSGDCPAAAGSGWAAVWSALPRTAAEPSHGMAAVVQAMLQRLGLMPPQRQPADWGCTGSGRAAADDGHLGAEGEAATDDLLTLPAGGTGPWLSLGPEAERAQATSLAGLAEAGSLRVAQTR